ncbi:MAG: hypothetical protein FH759_10745 [Sediminimonas qiaohouensis]|uniref:Uncharacterized protein n=1 Tax=Sediminimonas qiaohouensis TaxID=552061 RepID=A0A7C9L8P5_9RHOB|nr:hypothetical protein [Sediminimonas qiaohouensis]MTJ05153.1 hypothetical protein [Sediminimonas qiaohouensis]
MSGKYGFGGGIELPKTTPNPKPRPQVDGSSLSEAVKAGNDLGFVSREPSARLKPGPKRKEPQDKVSIPGPKRVVDDFRAFCSSRDLTLWQGLERLLLEQKGRGG